MLIEGYCGCFRSCGYCCPWAGYDEKGRAKKCSIFREFEAENETLRILMQSGIDLDRVPRLENLENKINNVAPILARIKEIEKGKPGLTLLISPNGTGKTHILAGLLFNYILRKQRVYYVTADKLKWIAGHMAGMDPCEKAREMHNQLQRSPVLMIDELGKEGAVSSTFENYLNPILDSSKRIYIATNFFLDGDPRYSLRYSTATMSRLRKAVVIKWEGKDYRQLKK